MVMTGRAVDVAHKADATEPKPAATLLNARGNRRRLGGQASQPASMSDLVGDAISRRAPAFPHKRLPVLLTASTGASGACANQCAVLTSAANERGCLPPNRYMDSNTTFILLFVGPQPGPKARPMAVLIAPDLSCMTASCALPFSLRILDAAGFDLLRPDLATIKMVREAVVGEAYRRNRV
jgi:hypothetical protein